MRIIGIDPGTRHVGYAVLDKGGGNVKVIASGTISPPPRSSIEQKLKHIFEELRKLFEEHSPNELALEEVFTGKSSKSAIRIGEGRGVALLCAGIADIPITGYTPTNVKLAVTGNGHASKDQVGRMVKAILGQREMELKEDEADAIAIALCHCHRTGSPSQ